MDGEVRMANATEGIVSGADGRIHVPRRVAAKRKSLAAGPPASRFLADTVKQLILNGELPLGAPVTEKWLTERFDVSRPTVRDALNLLVAERYLDQEPYKSARVRSYSTREVANILEARRLLEGYAAGRCDRASEDARTRLREAFATYVRESVADRRDAAAMADIELHVAIVGLAGTQELEHAEHDLAIGTLLLEDLINWRLQDSEKMYLEYLRLVTALLEPNPEEARRLSNAHIDTLLAAAYRQLPEETSS
jgi:DNA-binding GntR family transcriptional regulator